MSGWIEPTIEYIKNLEKAKNIDDAESLHEISHFVEKIGTNRSISSKNVRFDFIPPYNFTSEILNRPARQRGEIQIQKSFKNSLNPLQWALIENARTVFNEKNKNPN
jgi:hypothetical protein